MKELKDKNAAVVSGKHNLMINITKIHLLVLKIRPADYAVIKVKP